jgi:hypothetical protein
MPSWPPSRKSSPPRRRARRSRAYRPTQRTTPNHRSRPSLGHPPASPASPASPARPRAPRAARATTCPGRSPTRHPLGRRRRSAARPRLRRLCLVPPRLRRSHLAARPRPRPRQPHPLLPRPSPLSLPGAAHRQGRHRRPPRACLALVPRPPAPTHLPALRWHRHPCPAPPMAGRQREHRSHLATSDRARCSPHRRSSIPTGSACT